MNISSNKQPQEFVRQLTNLRCLKSFSGREYGVRTHDKCLASTYVTTTLIPDQMKVKAVTPLTTYSTPYSCISDLL